MKIHSNRKKIMIVITAVVLITGIVYLLYISLSAKQKLEQKRINFIESSTLSTKTKEETIKIEEFSYSITGIPVSISKEVGSFDFTVGQLKALADECGTKYETGYFDKLIAKFNGTNKIVYNFKYQGANQGDGIFRVTLLSNKVGYPSLEQFKKDFDQCAVAGDAYPLLFNSNWLLFVNSCGSGAGDNSGLPHGCDEIKKVVEPSLRLN